MPSHTIDFVATAEAWLLSNPIDFVTGAAVAELLICQVVCCH